MENKPMEAEKPEETQVKPAAQPAAPKKPRTAPAFLHQEWVFLGVAAILALIAGALYWPVASIGIVMVGLMMGASAFISYRPLSSVILESTFPLLTVSTAFGVFLLFSWVDQLIQGFVGWAFTWVLFASALLSLIAAFLNAKKRFLK
jgi:hypothetical protein